MKNLENYNNEFVDPYIHILPLCQIESIKDNYDYVIVSNKDGDIDIDIDKKITHTYFINKKKYSACDYKETSDMLINEIYKKLDLEPTISLEY
jgi:histidinol phosphatase-like enzyme